MQAHRFSGRTLLTGVLLVTTAVATLGFTSASVKAETLADAITQAYASNPTIQRQRALQRASDESYIQARAGLGPSVALTASSNYSNYNQATAYKSRSTTSLGLQLSQNIYHFGALHHSLSAAEASVMASESTLRSTEQSVLYNVIVTYSAVIRDLEALRISKESLDVFHRQLQETQAQFQAGTLTRTDVAQAESSYASAQAQVSGAQAQLDTDRASYAALIGQAPGTLEPVPALSLPSDYDKALTLAEDTNPDLLAARFQELATDEQLKTARADFGPKVSLSANYGGAGPTHNFGDAPRTNLSSASATLNISLPLFSAGLLQSQVRQAAENNNAQKLTVEVVHRQVLTSLAQAWSNLSAARLTTQAKEAQVKAAGIAAEGSKVEHEAGLRTTIDVLNDQLTYENAQLTLLDAHRNEFLAASQILVQTGQLEPEAFGAQVEHYNSEAHFKKVRGKLHPVETAIDAVDALGSSGAKAHKLSKPR